MTTHDERLGRALRELDVPSHGPEFYSRLAERLDQEPTHRRPGRRRPGWLRPPMLLSLAAVAAAVVAVIAMSSMFRGDRPDRQVEVGGGTIPVTTGVPAPTSLPSPGPTTGPTTTGPTTTGPTTGATIAAAPVPTTTTGGAPTTVGSTPPTTVPPEPTTTLAPAPTTTVPPLPGTAAGYIQATYDAWAAGDRAAAGRVAEPVAVATLFTRTWIAADGWVFLRCEGAAGSVFCVWQRPGEQLLINARNTAGGEPVNAVELRASP